jgi:histidine triad (HIT) family protein
MSENCLFCKIVEGQIPSTKVYEDEEFYVFHDINPAAPVHLLVVPKQHVTSMQEISELAPRLARENGCTPGPEGGFRLVINTGVEGGQEVAHLHMHIIGGHRPWDKRAAPAA